MSFFSTFEFPDEALKGLEGDSAAAIEALAGAIEANGTLLSLGLQNNGLDEASKAALWSAKEASDARRAAPLQLVL